MNALYSDENGRNIDWAMNKRWQAEWNERVVYSMQ